MLSKLAMKNMWPLHVTQPQTISLPRFRLKSSDHIEKVAQSYLFNIHKQVYTHGAGEVNNRRANPGSVQHREPVHQTPSNVTPAWAVPMLLLRPPPSSSVIWALGRSGTHLPEHVAPA